MEPDNRVPDELRPSRREISSGTGYEPQLAQWGRGSLVDNRPLWGPHHVPDNEYEALMDAVEGEEPAWTQDDYGKTADNMEAIMSVLTPKERCVAECLIFGQMCLREAGEYLGQEFGRQAYSKMGVSRLRDSALRKLRAYFEP